MSKDSTKWYMKKLEESDLTHKVFKTEFQEINELLPYPSKNLLELLKSYLNQISGIKELIIPNITIHHAINELLELEKYPFEIINPINRFIESQKNRKNKNFVLVGSTYTMSEGYLYNKLRENNYSISLPSISLRRQIDEIRLIVYNDGCDTEVIEKFKSILKKLSSDSKVIIACTELSMINNYNNKRVVDLARLQIEELL